MTYNLHTYTCTLHNRSSMAGDMYRDDKTKQVSLMIVQYLPLYIEANLEGKNNVIKVCILIKKKTQTKLFFQSSRNICQSSSLFIGNNKCLRRKYPPPSPKDRGNCYWETLTLNISVKCGWLCRNYVHFNHD